MPCACARPRRSQVEAVLMRGQAGNLLAAALQAGSVRTDSTVALGRRRAPQQHRLAALLLPAGGALPPRAADVRGAGAGGLCGTGTPQAKYTVAAGGRKSVSATTLDWVLTWRSSSEAHMCIQLGTLTWSAGALMSMYVEPPASNVNMPMSSSYPDCLVTQGPRVSSAKRVVTRTPTRRRANT
jgi:hypothetical protein